MKKIYILVISSFLLVVSVVTNLPNKSGIRESIIFFPIDPQVSYKEAHTGLELDKISPVNYSLLWTVSSTLDRKAYLRQDLGLLFSNGRLIGKTADWVQNTDRLSQKKELIQKQSALFEAVSFHYSELHEQNEQIFSSQTLSADRLYVIHQDRHQPYSFRQAINSEEMSWKQKLDEQTRIMLEHSWNKGIRHFAIPLQNYQAFPLDMFHEKAKQALPGFTKEDTERIVGNLWEGLYKNYYLGIKKEDGSIVNSIGSTLPLILLAKNKTHLLVLTETANGDPVLLRQSIATLD